MQLELGKVVGVCSLDISSVLSLIDSESFRKYGKRPFEVPERPAKPVKEELIISTPLYAEADFAWRAGALPRAEPTDATVVLEEPEDSGEEQDELETEYEFEGEAVFEDDDSEEEYEFEGEDVFEDDDDYEDEDSEEDPDEDEDYEPVKSQTGVSGSFDTAPVPEAEVYSPVVNTTISTLKEPLKAEINLDAYLQVKVNYREGVELRTFLRENKHIRDLETVLRYYPIEELNKAVKRGTILIKKGKIIL